MTSAERTHIFFAHPLEGWLLSGIVLAGMLLIAALWFDARRRVTPLYAGILAVLRMLIFAASLLLLLDPVQYQDSPGNEDWLGVMLDTSASMGASMNAKAVSRLDFFKEQIQHASAFHDLAAKHPLRFFSVNSKPSALESLEQAQVSQAPSNLLTSLLSLDRQYTGDPRLMGWILLSDGNTVDRSDYFENALPQLSRGVLTLSPEGSPEPYNLEITGAEIQEHAFTGQILPLKVSWSEKGKGPETARLTVRLQGIVLYEKDVEVHANEALVSIPINGEGILPLDIALMSTEAEVFTGDNQIQQWINAEKRKIKVFYIESFYKNENSFKLALEEDSDFEVHFATSLVGFAKEKRVPFILDPQYGFPSDKEKLFDYDVLVLSDVKRTLLKPEQMEWIEEWVKTKGGALIMIGGMDSFGDGGYCRSQLEQLLPVEISEEYQDDVYLKARGVVEKPFRIKLAPEAIDHPLLKITGQPATDKKLWEEMPPLGGYNYVGRVKPGATLLWQHPTDESKFGPRAILAVQPFGRGQVMAFTSDITPNWGTEFLNWRNESQGWLYAQFWRNALKWMTQGRLKDLTEPLDIQRSPRLVTENTPFEVRFSISEAIRQAKVEFSLYRDSHLQATRILYGGAQTGPLVWNAGLLEAGLYELNVKVKSPEAVPITSSQFFSVHSSREEGQYLAVDSEMLQKIADWTGSVYLPQGQLHRLEHGVLKMGQKHLKLKAEPLWNKPWIYVTVLAMLCAEWYIRKKKGFES